MNDPEMDKPVPRRPRRALAAFLEAHNILWGELVGGLLVVGCSLALVLTFWPEIRANPRLQVVTFTGAVAAIYGAGLYTFHRWKLETTSRGLLAIGMLLTPVCQLALTVGADEGLGLVLPGGSLLLLGLLTWRAARVLCPEAPLGLALAVVLTTACLVPVERQAATASPRTILLLGLLTVAATGLPVGAALVVLGKKRLDRGRAGSVFALLGLAAFPLVLVLGLLAGLSGDVAQTLGRLAVPLALAGLLPLASGIVVHRGLAEVSDVAGLRTAGTALALAGLTGMLLALGLAWPRPDAVLAVCALDFVVCTLVALRLGLPLAHVLALPCLAVALVSGLALASGAGEVPDAALGERMRNVATAPATGSALLVLAGICALVSEGLRRLATVHGRAYAAGSVLLALVAVGLVSGGGAVEPGRAALVYGLAGAGILVLNRRWRQPGVDLLGWALLAGTGPWALWHTWGALTAAWAGVFVAEAFGLAAWPLVQELRQARRTRTWSAALTVATAVALAALGLAVAMPAMDAVAQSVTDPHLLVMKSPFEENAAPWVVNLTWVGLALFFNLVAAARGEHWLAALASLLVPVATAIIGHRLAWPGGLSLSLALSVALLAVGVLWLRILRRCPALTTAWTAAAVFATILAPVDRGTDWTAPVQAASLALLAIAALLFAGAYRRAPLTLVGSLLLLAVLAHLLTFGSGNYTPFEPLLLAALLHASATLAVGLLLSKPGAARSDVDLGLAFAVFGKPLRLGALTASLLAAPLLTTCLDGHLGHMALYASWLAGLWILLAVLNRSSILFAASQAALFLAAGVGVAAVRQAQGLSLTEPAALQCVGVALAGVGLLWTVLWQSSRVVAFLEPLRPRLLPTLDSVILGLLVAGQLAVAVWAISPGLAEELGPSPPADAFHKIPDVPEVYAAAGPLAATSWPAAALVATLAAALGLLAWRELRRRTDGINPLLTIRGVDISRTPRVAPVLVGLLTLAITLAVLAAGRCADGRATATGLRWSLALCFVVCSLPVWMRDRLGSWAARWGLAAPDGAGLAAWARQTLVVGTVAPMLALTVTAAVAGALGYPVLGPAPDSLFARMGRPLAGAWPLGLVCFGLVVHALRERLPVYAFVVGLGGNVLASLLLRERGIPLENQWLPLLQANALAAGAVALVWLLARRRLYPERGTGALLVAQVALGVVLNVVLLAAVVGLLLLTPDAPPLPVSQAGGVLGWISLGLIAAAVWWNARASGVQNHLTPMIFAALAAGVLLAASSVRLGAPPWLGYRVLTVAWAGIAAGLLGYGWRRSAGAGTFPSWIQDVGLLVLGVALAGAARDPWRAWSPGVVLFVSGLSASLAVWQRRESRAFFAGLGLNLAAVLALPIFLPDGTSLFDHLRLIVRVSLLVAGGVVLLWLAGARWIYGTSRLADRSTPLLHLQMFGLLAVEAVLLLPPCAGIVLTPGEILDSLPAASLLDGLVVVTLAVAATVFAARTGTLSLLQLIGGFGLALGVLVAWTAVGITPDVWGPYRILESCWLSLGGSLLIVALVAHRRRPVGKEEPGYVEWILTYGVLVFWLAWRAGPRDPAGPWWSATLMGLLVAELTVLAWWRRSGRYLFLAGCCAQLPAGLVLARTLGLDATSGIQEVQFQTGAIVAGLTALVWLVMAPRLYGNRRPSLAKAPLLRLQMSIPVAIIVFLLLGPLFQFIEHPGEATSVATQMGGQGSWLALLATVVPIGWYAGGRLRRELTPLLAGCLLLVGVLVACTVARTSPGWPAFHALTGTWTVAGLLLLMVAYPHDLRSRPALATLCVAILGSLVLWLAMRVAGAQAFLRAAVIAGPVTVLALGLAMRRRREMWVLLAGLVVQYTTYLLVVYAQQTLGSPQGGGFLMQVEIAVAALFALVWMALARPLYGVHRPAPWIAPLLALYVAWPALANVAVLVDPLFELLRDPGHPSEAVLQAGHAAGWAALALSLLAVVGYAGRTLLRAATHGLIVLGLAVGVLAACTAGRWDVAGEWLAYHTLTLGWTLVGALIMTSGWRHNRGRLVASWGVLTTWLVLALGLRGLIGGDPSAPWGPAATILAAGGLAGGLALWRRRETWAVVATLCGNIAVCIVLAHSHRGTALVEWWPTLVRANVFALTAAASLWLLAARRLYSGIRPTWANAPWLTAFVAVVAAGAVFLVLDPTIRLVWQPMPVPPEVLDAGRPLHWLTVLAAGLLAARHLRFHLSRSGTVAFALLGLTAAAMFADVASWMASWFDRYDWLAYHVLVVGVVAAGVPVLLRARFLARSLRLADVPPGITPPILGWQVDLALGVVLALGFGLVLRETLALGGPPTGVWFPATLVLVLAGQAGVRALGRRSEIWAAVATLGWAFAVSLVVWDLSGRALDRPAWTALLQANSVILSSGALLWLAAAGRQAGRKRLPLVGIDILLALAANAFLLFDPPLLALVRNPSELPASVAAAGGWNFWLSWCFAALATCITCYVRFPRFGVHVLGGLGVAFGVLLACTAAAEDHGNFLAYHVLLVTWTTETVLLIGAAWWADRRRLPLALNKEVDNSRSSVMVPRLSAGAAQGWLILLGVPLLALAVRGVLADPGGPWWSAATVLTVATLAALLAAWLRHPAWALAAGLGIDLALSLVVWREHSGQPLGEWLLPLGQVVVVAMSIAALLWLALGRARVVDTASSVGRRPLADSALLVVQVLLALAGNIALLIVPVFRLILDPQSPQPLAVRVGGLFGWLALVPALAAALGLARRRLGTAGLVRVAPGALALAALAACSVARSDGGNWHAFQTLTWGWVAVALAMGWFGGRRLQMSTGLLGGLLLLLAWRALIGDFLVPWWSAGVVVAIGISWAGVALVGRSAPWASAAGLCANLATTLIILYGPWVGPFDVGMLVLVAANTAVAGVVALVWQGCRRLAGIPAGYPGLLLGTQILLPALGVILVLASAGTFLIISPGQVLPVVPVAGPWDALALIPAALALWSLGRFLSAEARGHLIAACSLCGLLVAAYWLAVLDTGDFQAYHALMAAPALVGTVLLLRPRLVERTGTDGVVDTWLLLTGGLLLVLGLRAAGVDPKGQWVPAAAVLLSGLFQAGLALRQRRTWWAFLAGLVANVAMSLLYLPIEDMPGLLSLVQANILASAVAALLWLVLAHRLTRRPEEVYTAPLLQIQVLLGLVGFGILLIAAMWDLILPNWFPRISARWCGRLDVWGTLVLAATPALWRAWRTRSAGMTHLVAVIGLAVGVLAACSAVRFESWHVYRVLTFTWLGAGAVILAGGWRGWWRQGVATWVGVFLALGVWLALADAQGPESMGWSAAAVAVATTLAAGVAVLRRANGWALTASLGANLAAGLLVGKWKAESTDLGKTLLQVSLATTAAATLMWVLAARGLSDDRARRSFAVRRAPDSILATLQLSLLVIVQVCVLLIAILPVLVAPQEPARNIAAVGGLWSWLALGLTVGALLAHFGLPRRVESPAIAGISLLVLSVQVSATVEMWESRPWFGFHLLTLIWANAGLFLAAVPWLLDRRPVTNDADELPMALSVPTFGDWQTWALPFGALTLLFAAAYGLIDPLGPWWALGGAVAAAIIGALLAVRRRQDVWALVGGLCVNLAVTLPLWCAHLEDPLTLWWLTLAQANVLAIAGVALAWLVAARDERRLLPGGWLLTVQIGLALAGNGLLLVGPLTVIVTQPGDLLPVVAMAGSPLAWLTLVVTMVVAAWRHRRLPGHFGAGLLVSCGLAAGTLMACSAAGWDQGHWLAYHTLMACWGGVASAVLVLAVLLARSGKATSAQTGHSLRIWAVVLGVLLIALALRAVDHDPTGPWAASATLLGCAVLAGCLAVWLELQRYVFTSGVLVAMAVTVFGLGQGQTGLLAVVLLNVLDLATSALVWVLIEVWLRNLTPSWYLRYGVTAPFAHVAVLVAIAGLALVAGINNMGVPLHILTWPAVAAVLLALIACLWDADARFPLAGMYVLVLVTFTFFVSTMVLQQFWQMLTSMAIFVSAVSLIAMPGCLPRLQQWLALPDRRHGWQTDWFAPTQTVVGIVVALLSLVLCVTPLYRPHPLTGPLVVLLLLPAPWLCVRPGRVGARGLTLALAALLLTEMILVHLPTPFVWLDLTAQLAALSGLLTLVYAVILPRLAPSGIAWQSTGRFAGACTTVVALFLMTLTLVEEISQTGPGRIPAIALISALSLAAVLLILAVAAVVLALRPALDPLGLSEKRRSGYVYCGELLIVLLAVHLRLALPWLFTGRLEAYWPFVVFALAFLGAGASELLGRLGLRVLARPLLRTGAFLPLLPVVGFWLRPVGDYATLWFLAGLFYGLLAVMRRSLAFALLALLAANGGLWVLLHDNQLAFIRYPQLWVVPLALSVLVAGQLNRDRLGSRQLMTLRYTALTVIYLASTADAFVGLGQEVWRPLVLIGLALAGVFLGMLLRVRAFLFLGTAFVALGMFTLVWHAATAGEWVWYAAGIALGIAIFTLFAIFEKRRADVLRMVERLRKWE